MKDETGWLIENLHGDKCVGVVDNTLKLVRFTDPNALRFARQVDGLRALRFFRDRGPLYLEDANVNEHAWIDGERHYPRCAVIKSWIENGPSVDCTCLEPGPRDHVVSREGTSE